jgi:predicted nucleic acid-binding protein
MSAAGRLLLDANVLVYAHDRNEAMKGPQARALLTQLVVSGKPLVSTQVISEFYWTVTRKIPTPLDHGTALAEVQRFASIMQIIPMTWAVLEKALQAVGSYGMPLWDAQIFAAAALHGADVLLTEDFQDGRVVEGVTFRNPFAPGFDLSAILSP